MDKNPTFEPLAIGPLERQVVKFVTMLRFADPVREIDAIELWTGLSIISGELERNVFGKDPPFPRKDRKETGAQFSEARSPADFNGLG